MVETLKNSLTRLNALEAPRKILLVGTVAILAAGFFYFLFAIQKPSYLLLYSGLSSEDTGAIVEELRKDGLPHQVGADGGSIMVPGEKVYAVRMSLAGKGLPHNGVGFEIFDKVSIGTTEFVQKMNYQRALQGELARTISQLSAVQKSRVHVTTPERSLFVEDQQEPTASVFLKLKPGVRLTAVQVKGITYLVSGAVEGLMAEKVTIMDTEGRVLSGPQDETMAAGLSSSQTEYQQRLERNLEQNVQTMLEKVIGEGKVIAKVSATLNFKRIQKTEELYDPNVTAVRSEQTSKEKSNGQSGIPGGAPGVAANIPGEGGATSQSSSSKNFQKQNETINYEINKVTRHVVEPVGTVERLSVAVLVDGIYQAPEGVEEKNYVPRTPEEMNKYETLVKGVVGFDEKRGDIVNMENIPFETNLKDTWVEEGENGGFFSPLLIVLLRYALIGVFGILFFLFVIKPFIQSLSSPGHGSPGFPATVGELESALEGNLISGLSVSKKQELKGELQKMVHDNPGLAATLVRDWLNEKR